MSLSNAGQFLQGSQSQHSYIVRVCTFVYIDDIDDDIDGGFERFQFCSLPVKADLAFYQIMPISMV